MKEKEEYKNEYIRGNINKKINKRKEKLRKRMVREILLVNLNFQLGRQNKLEKSRLIS